MRILAIILVFISLQTSAQDYHAFNMQDGDKWHNGLLAIGFGFCSWITDAAVLSGDTILEGQTYKKIYFETLDNANFGFEPEHGEYLGGIREDSLKRIYFFPKSTNPFPLVCLVSDTTELLLYDYGHQLGDTLQIFNPGLEQYDFKVFISNVDSILLNSEYRRMFELHHEGQNVVNPPFDTWIEGIGSNNGLLGSLYSNLSDCPEAINLALLACYEDPFTFYTTTEESLTSDCSIIDTIDENSLEIALVLYPNPTSNALTIEARMGDPIYLYDSQGKLIIEDLNPSGTFTIDVSHLEAGVYLVKQSGATQSFVKQ